MVWCSHSKSLILSPYAATNFFVALVRSSFTRREHVCRHGMPCTSVSIVALLLAQLSLPSMTFLENAQEWFSILNNDSWARFFNFNFDFLLMTSCHYSFSLSSSKHHACSSRSSSRTSSLMSPLSSSTAFRLLFQLHLVQFAAMCPVFSTVPANSGVTFATFLASSLGPLVPFQHDSLLSHPCRI